MKTPILFFSDTPSAPTGLARITRDLATRLATCPEFHVATVGYGACSSSRLPFHQYSWTQNGEWVIHDLPELWEDFAGDTPGIIFTIQDAGRMMWFSRPETCSDQRVAAFLKNANIKKWGYFPIDASGPLDKLSSMQAECLKGYDRILAYSAWADDLVVRTLGAEQAEKRGLDCLPHGIDTSVFYPRVRKPIRDAFGKITVGRDIPIQDDEFLVGIVATNQARKDFGLGIAAVAELLRAKKKVRLWIHTDSLDRYWSIPGLLYDHGVQYAMISLTNFDDNRMAELYSACDVTLAIGLGEGFGYPIFESLACGTPVVHGDYGGAAEWLPRRMKVKPIASRLEGFHASLRPVYHPRQWTQAMLESSRKDVALPFQLAWENLWPQWEKWFMKGIECATPSQSSPITVST